MEISKNYKKQVFFLKFSLKTVKFLLFIFLLFVFFSLIIKTEHKRRSAVKIFVISILVFLMIIDVLVILCAVKISGRESRQEEEIFKEKNKK